MLIEEILAKNPRASELESACRHIRRDEKYKFPPAISEVLKVIKEQERRWSPRWQAGADEDDDEHTGMPWMFSVLESSLRKAEEMVEKHKAETEAEAARNRAQIEANEARRKAEAEAKEARRKAEAEAEAARIQAEAAREVAEFEAEQARILAADKAAEAAEARRKIEAQAQAMLDMQAAYIRGRNFADEWPSMPLKNQLREALIIYGCGSMRLQCRITFVLGVFERRRELMAWRQEWARGKYGLPIWQ
jgi:hypothetical protein